MNDLTMIRGDSWTLELTILDSAGLAYDLTGATIWFTVGDLIEKTVGDGIAVSDPTTGVATITLDPEDTEGAPDQRVAYRYDVQVKLASGLVKTPVRGRFVVIPDVTTATS